MKTIHLTKVKIILVLSFIALIGLNGCNGDKDILPAGNCFNGNWFNQVEKELQAYSDALSKYNGDPSTANCEGYKKAGLNYIKALEKIKNCVPGVSRSAFDTAMDDAKKDIAAIACP